MPDLEVGQSDDPAMVPPDAARQHRVRASARMDHLAVLDRGQIAEKGTHQELLRLDGTYARLCQHQSGGFLDGDVAKCIPSILPHIMSALVLS